MKGIDILEVDLSWLIGRKSFTIHYILLYNRYRVNTRANAFALLNTIYIVKLFKFLNAPLEYLETLILIKGYNGNISTLITLVL